ncbi:MAG: tRNA epoxyqueuosine(34) reductase QueG [Muribaculaceae bacterium]|nr:tRNA epoxyqueuosine(34) reductase QueG [Muribaculaceae bacterium]
MNPQRINDILKSHGAVAVGVSAADVTPPEAMQAFDRWIAAGHNAGMGYMANHRAIRRDPGLLLEGARSVISLAFPFAPSRFRDSSEGMIACYAYGDDYHDALRARLSEAVEELRAEFGGEWRVCIDSAPLLERYRAVRAGIGSTGRNGAVIVPGFGSMVFLAELITTLELPETSRPESSPSNCDMTQYLEMPHTQACLNCGACVRACPGRAILPDGTVDARRCLSYLTIEHRGEWEPDVARGIMDSPVGKSVMFGCDICLRVCPLNKSIPPTDIAEFQPRDEIFYLRRREVESMTPEEFSRRFKGSPLKRAKLSGLKRNCGFK